MLVRVSVLAVAAALVGSLGGAASAAPPEVVRRTLGGPGTPTFHCGDRTISVTGGTLVARFRELPGERLLETFVAHGATAVDEAGNVYRLRLTGRFVTDEDGQRGLRRNVFIGPGGEVHRVQIAFESGPEGGKVTVTGDCTVRFPGGG